MERTQNYLLDKSLETSRLESMWCLTGAFGRKLNDKMEPATISQRALNMNGIMSMLQMKFGNAIYSQEIKLSFPEKMDVWYINQRMSDPS